MRTYELIYVLNPSIGEEAIQESSEKIKTLIERESTIENIDVWGLKRLAYEIQDQKEGYYTLVTFQTNPEFPKEIERVLRIRDDVMRFLVVRKEQ